MLIDITEVLKRPEPGCFLFNPSMVHVKEQLYLVCYRICRYVCAQPYESYHNPWKVWDNGYKFFSHPLDVLRLKYRAAHMLDGSRVLPFVREYEWQPLSAEEYDSTSIALITVDAAGHAALVYNIEQPFPELMNQDARLGFVDGQLLLSYNVFYKNQLALLYRTVRIDWAELEIYLGPEQFMFKHLVKVEKNCTLTARGHVQYSIGKLFTIIIGDSLYLRRTCPLALLIEYYGEDQVLCSLSTPPVPYGDKYIACAHIKIAYKKVTKEPLASFIRRFHFLPSGNVYPHGKYIYVACFYEFDREYNITRVSNLFLPTSFSSHLPYALVMPTGLTYAADKKHLFLAYGEGDRKCILLRLSMPDVEELLTARRDFMGAYFLTETPHIRHVGYFGAQNSGDDAFMYVFRYLQETYYPHATIEFVSPQQQCEREAHLTLLGGGDVINDYFAGDNIPPADVAVGVGVPYEEFFPLATRFKHIFTRNQSDVTQLKNVPGAPPVEYFPDLCFLLPRIFPASTVGSTATTAPVMGISVLRTYYHPDYPSLYEEYVAATALWMDLLLEAEGNLTLCLLPFGINRNKPAENDLLTCQDILERVKEKWRVQVFHFKEVPELYRKIQELSFVVCARFHSHVFSAAAQIPFVSVTCGRKCKQFMAQMKRTEYMFELEANEVDLPININVSALGHFIYTQFKQRAHQSLPSVCMKSFERAYLKALRQYTRASPVQLV